MKRFWKLVSVEPAAGGFAVALDGRPIRTAGGAPQVVPTAALAEALAEEWRAQGEEIDPKLFALRALADHAIDQIAPAPAAAADRLLRYLETDTLCYRAEPDEALYQRQLELWEPLLAAFEIQHGVKLERISGVIHCPQPSETLTTVRAALEPLDAFTLSALATLAHLAASLTVALAVLEPDADVTALFAAANAEEDWQAELWGWEWTAEQVRAERLAAFEAAARFARLARP